MPMPDACIVVATGPSLNDDAIALCRTAKEAGTHFLAVVNDAYKMLPCADLLYACDNSWWRLHDGCPGFAGEKWTTRQEAHQQHEKDQAIKKYNLHSIRGKYADGFSLTPGLIHYGGNSGFQAINLMILRGFRRIILAGFNMQTIKGKRHYFGNHPRQLNNGSNFESFVPHFVKAAKLLPAGITIINATPESAIRCFPMMDLATAIGAHADAI